MMIVSLVLGLMVAVLALPASADPGKPEGVGLQDPTTGVWHLLNADGTTTDFFFGNPGDFAVYGDWDCNGIDTPGLYRQSDGSVYLRNSNTQGNADIRFFFGNPGDVPLAGDFNKDGCDTVSIWRPSENKVYVINKLGQNDGGLGAAKFFYTIGQRGDQPFVGDFNGNAVDTVGLYSQSLGQVYLHNSLTSAPPDSSFAYGSGGTDVVLTSDWNGNGADTVGVFQAPSPYVSSDGVLFLRNSNSAGIADVAVGSTQSAPGWRPVAGVFQTFSGGGTPPPPIPEPNVPTVAQVTSGEVYGHVVMQGVVVARTSDDDDSILSDGTGEITIDLNTTHLDPKAVVLNVCYFIEGRAGRNEIDVDAMARCG